MQITTTPELPGREIAETKGIVAGETVMGVNVFRDVFAGLRNIFGGRSGSYQKALREARSHAIADMVAEAEALGADAIVGVDVDYESVGAQGGGMLMVSVNGTAVRLK